VSVAGDMSFVGTRGRLMLRVLSLDGLVSRRGRLSSWSSVISFERGDLTAGLAGSGILDGEETVGLV
jgi:hypothetical protein